VTYHERVARVMKASLAAGSLNSYATILARLKEKFPNETELRARTKGLEDQVNAMFGVNWSIDSAEIECMHCSCVVLLEARGIICDRCGATTRPRA